MLSRSMMTCIGRLACSLARSLNSLRTCSSMSDTILGLGAGLGASATAMSNDILKLAELLVRKGSMAVCLKKAVRGYGTVCHLSVSV